MNRFFLIFSFTLIICLLFTACNSGPEIPLDLNLQEVLNRRSKVTDPDNRFKDCKSYYMKQEVKNKSEDKEENYIIETKFKRPDYLKTVYLKNNKVTNTVLIRDGKAWNIKDDISTPITGFTLDFLKVSSDLSNPTKKMQGIFENIDLSVVKKGIKEYYKLICTPKVQGLPPIIIFIGKNSFLTKMINISYTNIYGQNIDNESVIKKYGLKDGVLIASETIVSYPGGKQESKLIDFKLNVDFPEKEFELPVPFYNKNEAKTITKKSDEDSHKKN